MKAAFIKCALLGLIIGSACGGTRAMTKQSPMLITTHAEAQAALGRIVQFRGVVHREKLGDTVNLGDLSVRCVDFQFPEVGATVTIEGRIEIMSDEVSAISATGDIGQGTEVSSSTFAIRSCVIR